VGSHTTAGENKSPYNVHLIADYNSYRGGLIRKIFPGSVGLVDPGDDSGMIINPNYQQYGTDADNEEFFYFVTRILSTINPTITNFKANKNKKIDQQNVHY